MIADRSLDWNVGWKKGLG